MKSGPVADIRVVRTAMSQVVELHPLRPNHACPFYVLIVISIQRFLHHHSQHPAGQSEVFADGHHADDARGNYFLLI